MGRCDAGGLVGRMNDTSRPNVTVLVSLKIFDNVVASAMYALRDRLGYDQVRSLSRSEYWRLYFPHLSESEAVSLVDRLVSKTALFANPNKHTWTLHLNAEPENLLPRNGATTLGGVLVEEDDDCVAAAVQESLRRRADCGPKVRVRRGIWWVMDLGETPASQARILAESIAITRARNEGLLCNPHYQQTTIVVSQP